MTSPFARVRRRLIPFLFVLEIVFTNVYQVRIIGLAINEILPIYQGYLEFRAMRVRNDAGTNGHVID